MEASEEILKTSVILTKGKNANVCVDTQSEEHTYLSWILNNRKSIRFWEIASKEIRQF